MLKLHSKCKRNLFLTLFFLIGLIGFKMHYLIILIAFVFLFYNLLKAIEEYNFTRIQQKEIRLILKKNWEKQKTKIAKIAKI